MPDYPCMRRPVLPLSAGAAAVVVSAIVATQVGAAPHAARAAAATSTASTATTTAAAPATAVPALTAPRVTTSLSSPLTSAVKSRMSKSTAHTYAAVVNIAGVGRVVDVNGGTSLLPASTEKLFTTLPLLTYRPQQRLVTTVGASNLPVNGVLSGDLVVKASGDPTVWVSTLTNLAQQVRASGIRKVTGRLVLNIGSLSLARTRSGWKSSYVPGDIGPLSPFPVSQDVWRSTSWYVWHPTTENLTLFRYKLLAAGVHVSGGNAVGRSATTAAHIFATHTSATLASIIGQTLRASDNFNAEQLLSIQGGMTPVSAVSRLVGASGYATDGSGLSLQDRRTAHGEVALLAAAQQSPVGPLLQASLPVACVSGTLVHEMCHTDAAGKVWAKTGTLDHVKALAGYTIDAQGRLVTFALLTSGDVSTYKAMRAMEMSVLEMRHYAG
jgi:D-alanyl-D-alanine carboxypeptidase/D-alanyl-D-alanine-endopeptidase (penicillin-binding protein 4)